MNFLFKLDKSLYVVLVTFILFGSFFLVKFCLYDFDISRFIVLGDKFTQVNKILNGVSVENNSWGYDGQFYYRLALNPFTSLRTDKGITLDLPALRHQRFLYPLFVWLMSFGLDKIVPYMMVLVNFLALLGIAFVGQKIVKCFHLHSFWGLSFVIYPGFILSFSRNLTEILTSFFILSTIYFLIQKRYLFSSLFLTLAVLTRETALILVLGITFNFLWQFFQYKDKKNIKVLFLFISPLVAYIILQFVLYYTWGIFPFLQSSGFNIGIPFFGLFNRFFNHGLGRLGILHILEILFMFFVLGYSIFSFKKSEADKAIKIAWSISVLMVLSATVFIWSEDWSFMRAMTELYIFSVMIIIGNKKKLFKNPLVFFCFISVWSIVYFKGFLR